jgi:hypothetical protein
MDRCNYGLVTANQERTHELKEPWTMRASCMYICTYGRGERKRWSVNTSEKEKRETAGGGRNLNLDRHASRLHAAE